MDAFGIANTSFLLLDILSLDVAYSFDDFARKVPQWESRESDLKAEGRAGRRSRSCQEDSCHAQGRTARFHVVSTSEQEVSLHLSPLSMDKISA